MAFQGFAPVSMTDVPNLIGAQSRDDQMNAMQQRENVKNRGQMLMGGTRLANNAMTEGTWLNDMMGGGGVPASELYSMNTAFPAAGETAGLNAGAMSEALRGGAPEALGAFGDLAAPSAVESAFSLAAPDAVGAALAPELGTLGLGEALGATAGFNEAGTLAALAAPTEAAAGAAGAAGLGGAASLLGPAGIALFLANALGIFG